MGRACSEAAGKAWPCQVPVWTPARLAPPPRCLPHTPLSSEEACCSTCDTKVRGISAYSRVSSFYKPVTNVDQAPKGPTTTKHFGLFLTQIFHMASEHLYTI